MKVIYKIYEVKIDSLGHTILIDTDWQSDSYDGAMGFLDCLEYNTTTYTILPMISYKIRY